MKILYIDLGAREDMSIAPVRYGGCRAVPAQLKQHMNDFYVLGHRDCFSSLTDLDRKDRCIDIFDSGIEAIKQGHPLKSWIADADSYDIVLHTSTNTFLNLEGMKARQVVWAPGQYETIHPEHKYLLLHSEFQFPNYQSCNSIQVEYIVLGIPIPTILRRSPKGYLFQCTNHYPQIGSAQLASWCIQNQVSCAFAGPISKGCSIPEAACIYKLGVINQWEKEWHLNHTSGFVSLYQFNLNSDSLAIKEALSFGCPVITTCGGNPHGTIRNGVNGFEVGPNMSLEDAVAGLFSIFPIDCQNSVRKYSVEKMVESFSAAFHNILC